MTKSELVKTLDLIVSVLESNRELITPDLLLRVKRFVLRYKDHPDVRYVLMGGFKISFYDIDRYAKAITEVLNAEEELVIMGLTDKIIESIKGLKNRPVVLAMLAGIL